MAEVLFYHLTQSSMEQTLPDLLQKSLSRGWRVLVRSSDTQGLARLEERIWNFDTNSFVPHGIAGGDFDQDQPILLSGGEENLNNADVLMLVDGARTTPVEVRSFDRVCLLFNGHDQQALDQARQDWKSLTEAGTPAHYWSQESGNWQKKASKNV